MVENSVFSALGLYANRFHESLACCMAIARIHVNVLTPKATRTMVGITTPLHNKTALFANKIFFSTLKFPCHYKIKLWWCLLDEIRTYFERNARKTGEAEFSPFGRSPVGMTPQTPSCRVVLAIGFIAFFMLLISLCL